MVSGCNVEPHQHSVYDAPIATSVANQIYTKDPKTSDQMISVCAGLAKRAQVEDRTDLLKLSIVDSQNILRKHSMNRICRLRDAAEHALILMLLET